MTKEKDNDICSAKFVTRITFTDCPLVCDVWQAEDGKHKGKYMGTIAKLIERTKACKSVKDVQKEAEKTVTARLLMAGITGRW